MRSVVAALALLVLPSFACNATSEDDSLPQTADAVIAAPPPSSIDLPGTFFAESLALSKSGTLYTGCPASGEIIRVDPRTGDSRTFVPAGVNKGSFGLKFDDARNVLWACDVDLAGNTTSHLRAFRAEDGELDQSFDLPAGGACADIAIGRGGVLYVTDIFRSTIMRLLPSKSALETDWCTSPLFAGSDPANPLEVGGIDWASKDGKQRLFVDKRDSGDLFTIDIDASGTCKPRSSSPSTGPCH